jgi:hypothetical protein
MGVARHRSSFVHLRHRNVPDRELVRDLRRVARAAGRGRLTGRLYATRGEFHPNTLTRRFGSWNAALRAAGLPVTQLQGVTDAVLFDNLAAVWRKIGRQPTSRELAGDRGLSQFCDSTYRLRFGSWHNALRAFETFMSDRSRGARLPQLMRSRRAESRPRSSRDISWRLRATVLIRDNCLCRMCGAGPAKDPAVTLHVDHIVPWSKGGQTVLANLQTLCAVCNIGKGDQQLVTTGAGGQSAGRRKWRRR